MQSSVTNTKLLNTEYVYCMSNKSFSTNLVKVGWTRNNPAIRANQLFTTGVPTPFVVEFMVLTAHGRDLEGRIHNHLASCRVSGSREFFNISVPDLRIVLTETFSLTLVQMPTIIDQKQDVCTIRQTRGRFPRCSHKSMSMLPIAKTGDDTVGIFNEPDELDSIFSRFRYRSTSLDACDTDTIFSRFRYRSPSPDTCACDTL
jgi:hypothetical protein